MSARQHKEAVVLAYVAAFNRGDAAAIAELYANDAQVEDPYDSPAHCGRDAIEAFYAYAMRTGAKLELDGPIRLAGNVAVFPFHVLLTHGGQPTRIDVIDLFQFDENGKIALMQAYWSQDNVSMEESTR
ncbi:nuclear transport factor 2 family protein [Sphingomonas sp. TDK1]|uniref:nuclear transport factor 2 family protein n=1 Tax=Sphingomonas sp. TDK1 TaxID=453247 RepID=UPI0007D94C99|nr:nuclear transport factor 2 family protein [Sphingomonas sp. TDK1]OAN66666.1 hypothetical protein A7X12_11190 [Sphingomonas sp. TDK1]